MEELSYEQSLQVIGLCEGRIRRTAKQIAQELGLPEMAVRSVVEMYRSGDVTHRSRRTTGLTPRQRAVRRRQQRIQAGVQGSSGVASTEHTDWIEKRNAVTNLADNDASTATDHIQNLSQGDLCETASPARHSISHIASPVMPDVGLIRTQRSAFLTRLEARNSDAPEGPQRTQPQASDVVSLTNVKTDQSRTREVEATTALTSP